MRGMILFLLAALSLAFCLISPVLHFAGWIHFSTYTTLLALASLAWFIFGGWWITEYSR